MRAKLRYPVVVHSEAGALQFGFIHLKERHAQGGVEHLRFNAINVLILDALHRVPAAGPRSLVACFICSRSSLPLRPAANAPATVSG